MIEDTDIETIEATGAEEMIKEDIVKEDIKVPQDLGHLNTKDQINKKDNKALKIKSRKIKVNQNLKIKNPKI